MRQLRTEITINATSEEVWGILMDHNSYPNWNPFIKQVSGSTQPGEKLQVTLHAPESKPMEFKPTVLVNESKKEFRWLGKLFVKGIFDGEHYFVLETTGPNKTRFIHGENFTGILSGLVIKNIGKNTLQGFNEMNNALKKLAETRL